MRLIVDSLIALMLVGILAAVLLHYQQEQRHMEQVRFVHRSLARLHEQATYRAALQSSDEAVQAVQHGEADTLSRFPRRVAPQWFEQELPLNVLVPLYQPWMDAAPAGDMADHPPDPVIHNPEQAGFWYNPNRGIFRARVPLQLSGKQTLRLYNHVNGTALASLPRSASASAERSPEPNPTASEPGQRFAAHQASATQVDRTVEMLRTAAGALLTGGPATASASASVAEAETDGSAGDASDARDAPARAERSADEADDADADTPPRRRRPTLLSEPAQ